jgi:hypothetical protein
MRPNQCQLALEDVHWQKMPKWWQGIGQLDCKDKLLLIKFLNIMGGKIRTTNIFIHLSN